MKIRVILADDHALIREGFKSLLSGNDWLEIVGEAENGKDLLTIVEAKKPDVVLIDINMPQLSGLEALALLARKYTNIKFIILTMHGEREYVLRALATGAHGYLLKNIEKVELEKAIKTVFEGGKYFSPAITNVLAESLQNSGGEPSEISPREKEVLDLVGKGFSTKQIADQLSISVRTVETHRINLLKKMRVNNSAELIKKAISLGLIS